ncbi:MAG: hypothetical protein ACI83H_001993 [Glaciecola sp.]|jgi:hypothetical protein
MKYINYIFIFFSAVLFSQNSIDVQLIEKSKIQANNIVGFDSFKNLIYSQNNSLVINRSSGTITYSNLQLGKIFSVNAFNPLKINLFYKDFGTVMILDNRLSEISKINFNSLKPFRNISHISTGNDNTIWCFNQDSQQLELFDYRTNSTKAKTLPIDENVIQITSNYNTCWLLTKKYLYVYNYFGSLLKKMKNDRYTSLNESNENIVLKKDNSLFYLKKDTGNVVQINLPNLLIKQFFVTNETLYIYDDEFLYQYQLITE